MRSFIVYTCALSLCLLVVLVACQGQNDTLNEAQEELFQTVYQDELAKEMRESFIIVRDMIAFKRIDMVELTDFLGKDFDHCNVTKDVSWIKGSSDYLRHNCRYLTNRQKLAEKYPSLLDIPSSKRMEIFNGKFTPYTPEEVMEMSRSRNSPDR